MLRAPGVQEGNVRASGLIARGTAKRRARYEQDAMLDSRALALVLGSADGWRGAS